MIKSHNEIMLSIFKTKSRVIKNIQVKFDLILKRMIMVTQIIFILKFKRQCRDKKRGNRDQ